MKKNKMMRLASSLLVAVLLTSSVISGTFAKYVTSDGADDSARVAKFGVVVEASGSLFKTNYEKHSSIVSDTDGLTVISAGTDDVVAPGTKNDEGIVFSITGQPEVDVQVTVAFTNLGDGFDNDVYLTGTDLPDTTTRKTGDDFDIEDYYPVKYTLWQKKTGDGDFGKVAGVDGVNLATLKSGLTTALSQYYDAGTDLGKELGQFRITWEWKFETDLGHISNEDKADTLLGNLADDSYVWADTKPTSGYNLKTGINFTITVTQVD